MRIMVVLALLIGLACAPEAMANKIKRFSVGNPQGFDRAPELLVYSSTGERWTAVDPTVSTTIELNLQAECQWEGRGNKAYRGKLSAPGMVLVGQERPLNFMIPHADIASGLFRWDGGSEHSVDPVKVCNDELDKRVANTPGKTRYHFLAEGFQVEYPAALRVDYRLSCKPTGLGFEEARTRSVKVNTVVQCAASAQAQTKLPGNRPSRARPPPPERAAPLVRSAVFEAEPEVHTADCPVTIQFNGSITTRRAGRVRYQYVKQDGTRSPVYALTFNQAGTLATRPWQTVVSVPSGGTTLSAGGAPAPADIQGWYRLDVLSPAPAGQVAAHYRVMCGADKDDGPAAIRALPAQRQPEVRQVTPAPARRATPVERTPVP